MNSAYSARVSAHGASPISRSRRFESGSLVSLLALLIGLLLITGCDSTQEGNPTDAFEIGIILPRTGAAASAGESVEASIRLTVDELNAYEESIGGGVRVEAVFRDSETDPSTALAQLEDLYEQGIRHVIGPYSSASCAAALDYANENGIVLLSPSSVASSLAIAGDNLFRLAPADTRQAEAVSALLSHDGISTIVPVVRDDVWGEGLLADLNQIAGQNGLTVQAPLLYDPSDPNPAALASAVAASIAETLEQVPASEVAVYLLSFGEGTDLLEAAAAEPNCARVNWYGSSAFANSAGLAANPTAAQFALQQRLRCPSFGPDPAAVDLWEPFSARLESMLGRAPEVYALTAHDAVWLMARTWEAQHGTMEVERFKAALVRVAEQQFGITGRLVFNAFGDRKQSSYDFWGLTEIEGAPHWRSFGRFSSTGELVLF